MLPVTLTDNFSDLLDLSEDHENRKHGANRTNKEALYKFLVAFAETGAKHTACVKSGVSIFVVNTRQKKDPYFLEAVNLAHGLFKDNIIAELTRRSIYGYKQQVLHNKTGKIVELIEYDSKALELLVKINFREEIHGPSARSQPQVVHNTINAEVVNQQLNFKDLSPEQLEMAQQLIGTISTDEEKVKAGENE